MPCLSGGYPLPLVGGKPEPESGGYFFWGFHIGARYFFTDHLGAFLELGGGLYYTAIGLAVKF
ncbi:MAG: hypothetical protein LBT14_04265 [Treponema sp.]|nr:hypothetical protein [Treponema sp.]